MEGVLVSLQPVTSMSDSMFLGNSWSCPVARASRLPMSDV